MPVVLVVDVDGRLDGEVGDSQRQEFVAQLVLDDNVGATEEDFRGRIVRSDAVRLLIIQGAVVENQRFGMHRESLGRIGFARRVFIGCQVWKTLIVRDFVDKIVFAVEFYCNDNVIVSSNMIRWCCPNAATWSIAGAKWN